MGACLTLHDCYVCGSMIYFLVSFIMLLIGLLISVNGYGSCFLISRVLRVIISWSPSDSYTLKWNVDHDFSLPAALSSWYRRGSSRSQIKVRC
ncbi:hypothetical protein NC652_012573 [Populus alba x Populus x berolinensis]|uniref:Transmembrane protein n=1 Tax=Populus alba x Populus x berolinensis TaxID=444605 RepID=A0AAD6QT75_9ROSI|nr:hypothetical protein NC652_012562 [Populus alba x Populus x berolinensis]KAJ6928496.1 hypothetical protein NC652_012570 [Populus alba x Populus x berolinensis]KAJ6928499.1 hypothetical protein NC652_012573 [Populus alba x Populus x berolinensis]KAJ6995759.1 hypothetical protein NC653_012581 [Populus alba x Populus x berolinensis]KAJ6995765.1 hypothetical protein NC653_012585 [Populus alba x Populus x berolinensis]